MSEFTQHKEARVETVIKLAHALLNNEKVNPLYKKYEEPISKLVPSDVITAIDQLMQENTDMTALKVMVNKLLNLIYKPINDHAEAKPKEHTFLWYLEANHDKAAQFLKYAGLSLKQLNVTDDKQAQAKGLADTYHQLLPIDMLYTIKENILFPALEKHWQDYRCVQLMWSYQDDIRRDLKEIIELLNASENWNMKRINRLAGDISFRIKAIQFRDEKILFPQILDTLDEPELRKLMAACADLEFPYVKADVVKVEASDVAKEEKNKLVDLGTGAILPEHIKLIFNHLPVDITYVDEHNKVQYYSTPKHRIFPRTKAVIGRDVHNCHPPESVHVVEKIVKAFRDGKRDKASFWIHMKDQFILIQYFAVRNEQGSFKGTLEVSQEISEIHSLEGDQRLLDWE